MFDPSSKAPKITKMEQLEDENYALEKFKARNEYEMKMLKEDHANKMNAKLNEFVKEFNKSKSGIIPGFNILRGLIFFVFNFDEQIRIIRDGTGHPGSV